MFLNPAILIAGLAAVAIPIIIHLLMRRKRQPVAWGAMRFIMEAYRQTRRRLLLERWLLLATRCLLLAAIALALGRPILDSLGAATAKGRTVYLVIDDSLTASVTRAGRSALDRSKAEALALIDALAEGDRVGVVTLAQPAQGVVLPPSSDRAAVREIVRTLAPTDARADLPAAMTMVAQNLGAAADGAPLTGVTLVALLSDWLEGSADLQAVLPRLPAGVRLSAAAPAAPVGQIGLTRLTPLREVLLAGDSGATQTVTIALSRSGPGVDEPAQTPVRVAVSGIDGAPVPGAREQTALVNWSRGERTASATIALEIDPSTLTGPAVLTARLPDDALNRDNVWRLPLDARPTVRVGLVAGRVGEEPVGAAINLAPAQWLSLALRPLPQQPVEISEVEPATIDAARLAPLDAVFVLTPQRLDQPAWSRLAAYARAGGLVVVTPPADQDVHGWADAMLAGLELPWQLPRQARAIDPADPRRPRLSAAAPATLPPADDLLAAVRGELPDLVGSVSITKALPPTFAAGAGTALLSLDDGTPVLVSARPSGASPSRTAPTDEPSRGAIVYLATALDLSWTDLPAKPLMVPLAQEVLRQGLSKARPALWTGAGAAPRLPSGSATLSPVGEGAPITLGRTPATFRTAGVWRALDTLGTLRGVLAVNPDASAQRTGAIGTVALAAWLGSALAPGGEPLSWIADAAAPGAPAPPADLPVRTAGELLAESLGGMPSASWWLAAALCLALIELILARRVSHAVAPVRAEVARG